MAGHSKWANIKHRKGAADAKKGKVTTRLVKEITMAAKMGGVDPSANPRLRLAIEKARENNVPKDNVERAIKRGTGEIAGGSYTELRFEGYGIEGAGIIVDCLTDNNIRTIADVRHIFTKYGGNLGTDGCVAYQFDHCGLLVFAPLSNEDELMEVALEAGANDIINHEDGSVEVITNPNDYEIIKLELLKKGFNVEFSEITMRPKSEVELTEEGTKKMQKLIDMLESLDDVDEVYHNAIIP